MRNILLDKVITAGETTDAIEIERVKQISIQTVYDVVTPGAKTFDSGVNQIDTLTFPTKATAVSGDYIAITDSSGAKWAVSMQKKNVETLTFPAKASATAGDFVVVYDTAGTAWGIGLDKTGTDDEPTDDAWTNIPAANKTFVDISATTTATSVAAAVELAVDALTGFSTVIATDDTAADGTMTFTQASIGGITPAIPKNADGSGAGSITAATTILGANAPTGAIWAAIPAANKAQADISSASTAANVATAVRAVLAGITGIGTYLTIGASSGATIPVTQKVRGPVAVPVPKNKGDSGAGTITTAATLAGVASEVDVTADTITIPSHGFTDGAVVTLTTDGTLPAGLATSTDYTVKVVDANTVQLYESGVLVDITDQGSGGAVNTVTHTALAGFTVKFQKSLDAVNWIDIAAATTITADGTAIVDVDKKAWVFLRAIVTLTTGVVDFQIIVCGN